LFGRIFKRHWILVLALVVMGICVWVGTRLWRRVDEADGVDE
jgi:hypothetical protein